MSSSKTTSIPPLVSPVIPFHHRLPIFPEEKKENLPLPGIIFQSHSSSTRPDCKFQGWWRNVTYGNTNLFDGFNAQTSTLPSTNAYDSYIYIDTTVYPVQVITTYGTNKYPRLQASPIDPTPVVTPPPVLAPTPNSYVIYENNPKQLISPYNTFPHVVPAADVALAAGPTLLLVDDDTINVGDLLNIKYVGPENFIPPMLIYKRMCEPPAHL